MDFKSINQNNEQNQDETSSTISDVTKTLRLGKLVSFFNKF